MNIFEQLATNLGRRDEVPNKELAAKIIAYGSSEDVKELVELLKYPKKDIQFDAIKTIYEVASIKPEWVAPFVVNLLEILSSKQNRMVWGAMTALSAIAPFCEEFLFENILLIISRADSGSVITRDHAVNILVTLNSNDKYKEITTPLLLEQILKSPENQFPTYAEKSYCTLDDEGKTALAHILSSRKPEMVTTTKVKRVDALIKKLMLRKNER